MSRANEHCPICGAGVASVLSHRCKQTDLDRIDRNARREPPAHRPSVGDRLALGFDMLSMAGDLDEE